MMHTAIGAGPRHNVICIRPPPGDAFHLLHCNLTTDKEQICEITKCFGARYEPDNVVVQLLTRRMVYALQLFGEDRHTAVNDMRTFPIITVESSYGKAFSHSSPPEVCVRDLGPGITKDGVRRRNGEINGSIRKSPKYSVPISARRYLQLPGYFRFAQQQDVSVANLGKCVFRNQW